MRTSTASIALALISLLTTAACGGDDGGDDDTGDDTGFTDQEIIVGFADNVVIPTYQELADRTVALDAAITTLATTTNDANLEAAKTAWSAMRQPWEQSEGFLFGPVSAQGWDPAMDSWPLNQTDLEGVLASGDELTQEYIRGLPETQKGFHTVEFLLWGTDSEKTAAELTPRELEYLAALTEELVLITADLETSWTDGIDGGEPYRTVLTTAGETGNTAYPSIGAAAQEILVGMSGICDEVANGKIADPFDAMDPNLVESQYSFNSLLDFQDNIRSVQNAYTGDFPLGDTTGRGLTDYVATVDAALDTRVKAELTAAIDALGQIPTPFRDAIQNPDDAAVITAAQEAIRTLQATIDGDLTTAVLGQ